VRAAIGGENCRDSDTLDTGYIGDVGARTFDDVETRGQSSGERLASSHFNRGVSMDADRRFVVDGLQYAYDPTGQPPFVLVPECDECGGRELDQFLFEEWVVDGVRVRGQTHTTCRRCRFHHVGSPAARPMVLDVQWPEDDDEQGGLARPWTHAFELESTSRVEPTSPAQHGRSLLLASALVLLALAVLVAVSSDLPVWDTTVGRAVGSVIAAGALALAIIGGWRHRPRPVGGEALQSSQLEETSARPTA
jgi:hypothetical protein